MAIGTVTGSPPTIQHRVWPSPWPSAADYTTIKIAVAVRDDALFRETDARRKSFAAFLALRTLLTVRIAAGPCAAYVTELYGNLRDLQDAYPGENWRPLVRVVHREPSLPSVCRPPTSAATGQRPLAPPSSRALLRPAKVWRTTETPHTHAARSTHMNQSKGASSSHSIILEL